MITKLVATDNPENLINQVISQIDGKSQQMLVSDAMKRIYQLGFNAGEEKAKKDVLEKVVEWSGVGARRP